MLGKKLLMRKYSFKNIIRRRTTKFPSIFSYNIISSISFCRRILVEKYCWCCKNHKVLLILQVRYWTETTWREINWNFIWITSTNFLLLDTYQHLFVDNKKGFHLLVIDLALPVKDARRLQFVHASFKVIVGVFKYLLKETASYVLLVRQNFEKQNSTINLQVNYVSYRFTSNKFTSQASSND